MYKRLWLILIALALIPIPCATALESFQAAGLPVLTQPKTYTIAVEISSRCENSFADKQASIMAEEATGIHIEWIEIPAVSWNEQVNILIASGDLPDAFCSMAGVDTMTNNELFAPLTGYIEQYAPNITEMLDANPELRAAITSHDGEIYSLPTGKDQPAKEIGHSLWINVEWLDALGLEMPKTTDEFVEVLKAFRDGDPNGNGITDEIPLMCSGTTQEATINPLFGAFGTMLTNEYVYSLDGETVLFCGEQEGFLGALEWLHLLYEEGLLYNGLFTMTSAELTALATNPDTVLGCIMLWSPDSLDARYAAYEIMDPLVGPDGSQYWSINAEPLGQLEGFCITTACEDPEVLVRYYDYNISTLETALTWMYGPDGAGCWEALEGNGAGKTWQQTSKYVTDGMSLTYFKFTAAGGDYSPMYLWNKYTDAELPDARNQKKLEGISRCLPHAVTVMPNGVDNPERASERDLLFVDIDNYMQKFIATSIVNGIDAAAWESHLATLSKLNVDGYVSLWQAYFAEKTGK